MPLIILELTFIQTIRRDFLADTLTVAVLVELPKYLWHGLALTQVEIVADLIVSLVGTVFLGPLLQVILDLLQCQRAELLPFLVQVVRYLDA